ncbi:hypothetical protein GCM10022247_56390 [Allokutzneria multivorans]|uniref:Carrier domain-containing protein n=1 Tax=Allokutzneria multivorans TaxID=1142134 RepID=A0ABP7TDS9_9PSEU
MGARDFWQDVLGAAGFTALPRWTALVDALSGVAAHDSALTSSPSSAELLAAHAKVISALSGEAEIRTGYAPSGGAPLPCAIAVGGTWPELVAQADKVAKDIAAHAAEPLPEGVLFEVVLGDIAELPENIVLAVSEKDGLLRLRYRTEAFDTDHIARIAGYYRTALDRPDAVSLLSHEELDFQFDGLAGPERELPDRRFHELFEDRVRQHPDKIAVEHGDRSWTYAELNRRANRIGRALRARGLSSQDVVALVTERNLDWLASVLAIFKAGGGYLPIEPHFPAERIGKTLRRAECALVLTERGSTQNLDQTTGFTRVFVDEIYAEAHDDNDLGIAVGWDDLAYIYFTSGSTGEPKGAMCEHAGMLNHLYAKIDDFGIAEGSVIAQIAPQCFDISLWQLVSALLVGGRTVIVDQEAIMDVQRFVSLVSDGIDVMQVVPSYLEVVLSHLEEHSGDLGRLHCVSATGEALKKELAQRWFAAFPDIKLANAYGLTETSDDTNHEVMSRAPERERVPLGRAVNNVRVYVVDENLNPVPLGSPGEIVFSGVCVGRGYINDPERTAAAFLADPHRSGERLYRSGDFGRWLPEGKLEFLGRRDAQVKIRGFRIEIGEIENRLLSAAGVRDAAVVVDQGKTLVAFYSTPSELPGDQLREHLAAELPEYMVPSHFHWMAALPLTGNGKIDKKHLTAVAAELKADEVEAPRTATEWRIAAAWAEALGVAPEEVGRDSHFFDSGGTSLSAVRLVVKLERAISLKDLTRTPVLADLAAAVDSVTENGRAL